MRMFRRVLTWSPILDDSGLATYDYYYYYCRCVDFWRMETGSGILSVMTRGYEGLEHGGTKVRRCE